MPRRPDAPPVSRASETFSAGGDARWVGFLELEHGTLARVVECELEGERVRVTREAAPGRSLAEGRVPRPLASALLLQGTAAAAFLAERGFPLRPDDVDEARWDVGSGAALLSFARAPRSVDGEDGREPGLAGVVGHLLERLFGRAGRLETDGARSLARALAAADAPSRRPGFWPAAVLRAFPELASPAAAAARRRCLGVASGSLRSWRARAWLEIARAACRGSRARLFGLDGSPLEPGSALGLDPAPKSAADGTRRLRALAPVPGGGRRTWVAAAGDGWDSLSRRAFAAAVLRLGSAVELVEVPASVPPPDGPDAWRRALWLPFGTVSAAVRFFEWLSELAPATGPEGRERAADFLASSGFGRFAADPTGQAPLPLASAPAERTAPTSSRRAEAPATPAERIAAALGEDEVDRALELANAWIRAGDAPPEAWFSLSAALSARTGGRVVPWLELLESEREAAGGLAAEARQRLDRVARHPATSEEERRRAQLRAAELSVRLGEHAAAARRAAAWRRDHTGAPAAETMRALCLGAEGLAREGRTDCAMALLDEAEGAAHGVALAERLDLALTRAHVHALAGRFEEEDRIYAEWRAPALGSGDDRLVARFLAQEARGLLDRRDFGRAALRFEEALGAAEDAAERSALSIDLAATRYHAGDRDGSERALADALAHAAAAGREDLARLARGNRVELLLDRCDFDAASTEITVEHSDAIRSGDERRRLVALHHRARLALRRGELDAARRDNAAARSAAEALGDRLEIGELWLEEGDRAAYEGDLESARRAWETAARDLPDRCDTDRLARERLSEIGDGGAEEPSPGTAADLERRFDDDAAGAAERVARWCGIFGGDRVPARLRERAAREFDRLGVVRLAALVRGRRPAAAPPDAALRTLRGAVAGVLAGDGAGAERALPLLGLSGLRLREPGGREVLRLDVGTIPAGEERWRPLEAGAARFELGLRPGVPEETAAAVALMLESLLHRVAVPAPAASDYEEGWRRLGLVTGDVSMEEPYRRLARFAPQGVTVLVLGESGSGKEAVARAVHRLSPRAGGSFVAVNVPAIPAGLAESELFGHARGAFSGADRDRKGLLEEAHGGTVFFDEIGDLPPPLQSKLLRALQEREVRRVGENRARPVDVRIVSATSRNLAREVEAGRFREDLFYRLHVACVRLPALRERGRDALLLARHFLERFGREYGRGPLRLSPEAGAAILEYPWPGNVRELENAVAQAAALSDAGPIGPELLPEPVRGARRSAGPRGDYRASVDAHRRDLIADALERSGGNRSRAARDLGLSRQALLYLIKELKVDAGRR